MSAPLASSSPTLSSMIFPTLEADDVIRPIFKDKQERVTSHATCPKHPRLEVENPRLEIKHFVSKDNVHPLKSAVVNWRSLG